MLTGLFLVSYTDSMLREDYGGNKLYHRNYAGTFTVLIRMNDWFLLEPRDDGSHCRGRRAGQGSISKGW